MSDEATAIVRTNYGALGRTGATTVTTCVGGGIRLAVSHSNDGCSSYTSEFCTGLEMPPAKWREVIRMLQNVLPPETCDPEFQAYMQDGGMMADAEAERELNEQIGL